MKVNFTFRHLRQSNRLIELATDKINKLVKYEMKPSWVNIVVSKQRHLFSLEIKLVGKNIRMSASTKSDDLYEALDLVISKLGKQMHKKKKKVQNHKLARRSKEYTLNHFTNASLDVDYDYYNRNKKSA